MVGGRGCYIQYAQVQYDNHCLGTGYGVQQWRHSALWMLREVVCANSKAYIVPECRGYRGREGREVNIVAANSTNSLGPAQVSVTKIGGVANHLTVLCCIYHTVRCL